MQMNIWGTNNGYYYFISPAITATQISSTEISFYAYFGGSLSDTLQVGVISDPSNVSTFAPIASFVETTTTFVEKSVSFENYIGTGQHIAFLWRKASGSALFLDDIVIDEASDCPNIADLQIGNIAGSTAQATWQHAGNTLFYNIEYGEMVEGASVTSDLITNNYFNFSRLSEATHYFFAVKATCDNGESMWDTVYFSTICNAFAGPQVGTDTTSSNELPISGTAGMGYSYSQQIFTLTEMGNAATEISAIAIQYPSSVAVTRSLDIYLAHTDSNVFSTNQSWIPASDLTCYFSGVVSLSNEQENNWAYIMLDSTFHYNGEQNLVMGFLDKTGVPVSSMSFWASTDTMAGYKSIYLAQSIAVDITNANFYGSLRQPRSNTRFLDCYVMNCLAPVMVQTDFVSGEETDISWTEAGNSTNYLVEYKVSDSTEWIYAGDVNATFATLTNLTPLTRYDVRVKALCSQTDSSDWSAVFSFTTNCPAFPLSLSYDFDELSPNSAPDCWTIYSTLATQPATTQNDAYSGRIAFGFGITTGGMSHVSLPELDLTSAGNDISISFRAKSDVNNLGFLTIGVLNALDVRESFVALDTVRFENEGTWEEIYFQVTKSDLQGKFLTFLAWNASAYTIDDLLIEETPACLAPSQLTITGTSHNSISFDWNERNNAIDWVIAYGAPGFDIEMAGTFDTIMTKPHTITGLSSNTDYEIYIRSICSVDDRSTWNSIRASTACGVIYSTEIPYSESFDQIGLAESALPECWKRFSTYDSNTYPILSTINNSAPASMRFTATAGTYSMLVMKAFEDDFDFSDKIVRFQFRSWGDSPEVQIGILTDGGDPSTFTLIDSYRQGITEWMAAEIDLSSYTGDGRYLALKAEGAGNSFHLDDILIAYAPTCFAPTAISVSNVTAHSTDLNWTPAGTDTAWIVAWTNTGLYDRWTEVYVSGTPQYTLPSLSQGLSYSIKIKAICGEGDTSYYSNDKTFETLESCSAAPTGLVVTAIDGESASFTWDIMEDETHWQVIFGASDSSRIDTAEITTNSYTANNLTPNTDYFFNVKAICNITSSSPYANITFTTQAITTHTIEASAGSNGTITPSGSITVTEGDDITFSIRANEGYVISAIMVDGDSQPVDTFYTFTSVNDNHSISIEFAVGINEISSQNRVNIYPNPTNNIIKIDMESDFDVLQITNPMGETLLVDQINNRSIILDVSSYPTGIYFITLKGGSGSVTKKVIKINE
jgi:hypothetical protein